MESSVDGVNVSILNRFIRDELIKQLEDFHGKKDLIIDEELLRPFDRFAGVSLLKNHGVEKIVKLEGGIVQNCEKRMYITRPYISRMKLIVDHIKKDIRDGLSMTYRVCFSPKRLAFCETFLEEEGVFGGAQCFLDPTSPQIPLRRMPSEEITVDEFPLDFIVLDNDLLSLEMPLFYQDFYQNNDFTWVATLARSISSIQSSFGTIPHVACFGRGSKMVYELLQVYMSNEREYHPPGGPEISSLILIDRDIDLVTPLCSQLTYEGLLSDVFGISAGYIDFGKEVTGRDKSTRVLLDSNDLVFQEIRDLHVGTVFPHLRGKARQLQTGYDKGKDFKSLSEMKDFVSQDLKNLEQQHKSLSLHISAGESILKRKSAQDVKRILQAEHSLLDDIETKENMDFIEERINRQLQPYDTLRLLCLLSQVHGEIPRLKSLKHQYLQSYGYQHIITFNSLAKAGIYIEGTEKKGQFQRIRKKMNLIPKDPSAVDLQHPADMSYVFGGAYSPFSIRIIEQYLSQSMASLESVLNPEGVSMFEERKSSSARVTASHLQPSSLAMRTKLLVFFGGCTHSEMSALRFLSKQKGYKFLVLTTGFMTGISFIKPFSAV